MPARESRLRHVVDATLVIPTGDGQGRGFGDLAGPGGRADLVVHHGDRLPLVEKAQHGEQEVRSAGSVHPGKAEDQVTRVGCRNGLVAGKFCPSVGRERTDLVRLAPGTLAGAVVDVVGGVVDDGGSELRGLLGQHLRPGGIDGVAARLVFFGLVDGGVGGGVHHDLRLHLAHQLAQTVGVSEIYIGIVQRRHLAQRRQGAQELPADLTIAADEKDGGLLERHEDLLGKLRRRERGVVKI